MYACVCVYLYIYLKERWQQLGLHMRGSAGSTECCRRKRRRKRCCFTSGLVEATQRQNSYRLNGGRKTHLCFFFLFLLHSSPVFWEQWGVHVWEFMFLFSLRWLTLRVPTQTCVQFCVLLCACLSRKVVTLILLLFFYPLLNPLCFPFTFPLYERKCAAFEKEKKKKRERKGAFLWKARVAVLISLLLGLFFFPPFFVAGLSEYGEERVPLGLTEGGGETNKKK